MNLTSLETAMREWFRPLVTHNGYCHFAARDGKASFGCPVRAFYSFTSIVVVGQNHDSYDLDNITGKFIPSVSEIQHINVTLRIESFDQRADFTAQNVASKARTRLSLPANLARFREAGYAVNTTGTITNLPFQVDDRLHSLAVFEVQFATFATESETNVENQIGQVDSVEITSETLTGDTDPTQISLIVERP